MRTGIRSLLASLIRFTAAKTGVLERQIFSVYPYAFNVEQLRFLMDCVKRTAEVPGVYVEAGCSRGATTALLNKWMDTLNIQKRYYALDTFSGFLPDHIDHEINTRKKSERMRFAFTDNKKAWFDHSMQVDGITRVVSVETDVAKFNFDSIGPIAFCLLDVDLYLPIAAVLPRLFEALSSGGIIVVDDCAPNQLYDGALQAYQEFMSARGLELKIVHDKLGIIEK